jgi:hypothetical protein
LTQFLRLFLFRGRGEFMGARLKDVIDREIKGMG